jgi:A/G-specific adenine glycosylase
MELGATVCVPGEPRCGACPVSDLCEARKTGRAAELPIAAKKKPPREVALVALVSRRKDRVLLGRRREAGLFGGLWEPPMIERRAKGGIETSLGALFGEAPSEWSVVGVQTHVLTHRKFRITVVAAELPAKPRVLGDAYDRVEWRRASDLAALGMSSLAKKILLACPVSP